MDVMRAKVQRIGRCMYMVWLILAAAEYAVKEPMLLFLGLTSCFPTGRTVTLGVIALILLLVCAERR